MRHYVIAEGEKTMFRVAVSTKEIDGLAARLARISSDMSEAMSEIGAQRRRGE